MNSGNQGAEGGTEKDVEYYYRPGNYEFKYERDHFAASLRGRCQTLAAFWSADIRTVPCVRTDVLILPYPCETGTNAEYVRCAQNCE